jgi:hypothetical protein
LQGIILSVFINMSQFQQFDDEKLQPFYDAQVGVDVESLQSILPKGMCIPQDIVEKTNMCWANVLLILARMFGRKISRRVALLVFSRIRNANSTMKSPTQMPELVDALNLPVTLIEYSLNLVTGTGVGWSFGPSNGNREIFLCNIGAHYQIFVRPGTTLGDLGMVTPPASYKLFPSAHKIIEGTSLSKSMLDEVKAINNAYTQSSTRADDCVTQQRDIDLVYERQLADRNQQELDDANMARQLADRNQQELDDANMARQLDDANMARQLADRNQQELDDANMARQLAGLSLMPRQRLPR